MSEQAEHLQALMQKQREQIEELENENQHLKTLTETLNNRVRELERQRVAIDREMAEIPIGLDLIPEDDLKKS